MLESHIRADRAWWRSLRRMCVPFYCKHPQVYQCLCWHLAYSRCLVTTDWAKEWLTYPGLYSYWRSTYIRIEANLEIGSAESEREETLRLHQAIDESCFVKICLVSLCEAHVALELSEWLILNPQNQELNKLSSSINNAGGGVQFQQQKTAQDSPIASPSVLTAFSQVAMFVTLDAT